MKERSKKTLLRKRAEKVVAKKKETPAQLPCADDKRLVEELRIHQVELEIQNEELRKAQAEIEMSRSKYADLYDFAPAGYFTFDRKGCVKELNLSGARMLGIEKSQIIDKPFQFFVSPGYRDIFSRHRSNVLSRGGKERCELELIKADKTSFHASLESIAAKDEPGKSKWIRSAIMDITELKKRELAQLESEQRVRLVSLRLLNAQEEERRKIAGELHDTLGSSLVGIKYKTEALLQQPGKTPDDTTESLKALIRIVQDCIEECRRIQMDLRPAVLDDLGLQAAFSWFFRRFEATYSHIRIEQEIAIAEDNIPNPLKTVIYRVTQEAFNNIVKHSKANRVAFSLKARNSKIELAIRDYGKGFDIDDVFSRGESRRGMGLASMKERTMLLGGLFIIKSADGKGTTIHASWPIS